MDFFWKYSGLLSRGVLCQEEEEQEPEEITEEQQKGNSVESVEFYEYVLYVTYELQFFKYVYQMRTMSIRHDRCMICSQAILLEV